MALTSVRSARMTVSVAQRAPLTCVGYGIGL